MWDYDGNPTKSQGILPHVPITLAVNIVLIDIEAINAQLDYNLLLNLIFYIMMFPHEGKIVTIDHLTYHDPQGLTTPANVIPTITTIEPQGATTRGDRTR